MSNRLETIAALARKIFLPAAVALLALAGMDHARAGTCTITGNQPIAFGQINIQSSAEIGDTIAAMTVNTSGTCPSSTLGYRLIYLTGPWASAPMEGVWGTSVSGLGVRLTSTTTTPNTGTTTMVASGGAEGVTGCQGRDTSNPCRYGPDQPATANGYPITISMKVELVKIAPTINTGQSLTGYVFGLSALNIADSTSNAASAHTFSGTSFVTSTCTRTSPDPLVVKLPPLTAAQLSPPGTTGGDTPFSLDFTCATARNVRMTMTDVQNLGTADDKLALSPDSASATGVKLQVLFKGTPIIFNPNSQATGIAVGSSTGGGASFSIPLTVHYISTGTVTPGTVNASAIYTLSYQ